MTNKAAQTTKEIRHFSQKLQPKEKKVLKKLREAVLDQVINCKELDEEGLTNYLLKNLWVRSGVFSLASAWQLARVLEFDDQEEVEFVI